MLDLSQSCLERRLEDSSRVVGTQLQPGTQTWLIVTGRVVGELDAEMSQRCPPPGKLTMSIG